MKSGRKTFLPVEVVFSPSWWHNRHGLSFDRDFFFDPMRRVEDERRMRAALATTFPDLGLGEHNAQDSPVIGAINLAAGYFIAEALGCDVIYHKDAPPDVIPMNMAIKDFEDWQPPDLSKTNTMTDLISMVDNLMVRYGSISGDVNWSGIQNTALDLRGQSLFTDYYDRPAAVERFLDKLTDFILQFVTCVDSVSNSSSISVNRLVSSVDKRLHLHSNCTVAMISTEIYNKFLLPMETRLAKILQPYGIHHCGDNMERFAASYSKAGEVSFYDVGWNSDVAACRKELPDAFLSLRLSPVRMTKCTPDEVISDVRSLAAVGGSLDSIGFCCINLDEKVPDENVRALYYAVECLRKNGGL